MEKILCVDDEQSVLDGFQRHLRKLFALVTATSGEEGLKAIAEQGPFAVIVSDMRMPGMDGIQFFLKVREFSPDSVRIMLTGAADLQTAIEAVNRGSIFRFLSKPAALETLFLALQAGVEQYRLITAEKMLLENTLKGSIKVLVDILSMTNPSAFSRAMRIRHYAAQIAGALQLHNLWQYEVAAMLSQIGCVTIPGETLDKYFAGAKIADMEQEMIDAHPAIAKQLISNIPRMEIIAEMIARQEEPCGEKKLTREKETDDPVLTGARILKAIINFDILLSRGLTHARATEILAGRPRIYDARVVEVLKKVEAPTVKMASRIVKVKELHKHMILDEDVRSNMGVLVVPKGQEVNDSIRQRLVNFNLQGTIPDTIRVLIPEFLIKTGAHETDK